MMKEEIYRRGGNISKEKGGTMVSPADVLSRLAAAAGSI
jgi:hypothetical protein